MISTVNYMTRNLFFYFYYLFMYMFYSMNFVVEQQLT